MLKNKIFELCKISSFTSAIIVSIILGILLSGLIMYVESAKENYSTLGIRPEFYNNFPQETNTSFVYEVKSFEKEKCDYLIEIYLNNDLVNTKTFSLKPGEVYESREILNIGHISFPSKVEIKLNSPLKKYSVHYWLKER